MSTTTSALSIPAVQGVQPKPTKTEIIEAMVARAKAKHDEESERRAKMRKAISAKIESLAIKLAKSKRPDVGIYVYSSAESSHCDVTVRRVKSPELDALFDQYRAVERICWDEKKARDAIRREINGAINRNPSRLLDNPEAVKAIDATLKQWGLC